MNIMNRLTIRHLKQNRRRTLVTMIGAIISVAMIMAVASLGISFLDMMKRQTIANDGEWHVYYKDANPEQLKAIRADTETQKMALIQPFGYALLEGSQNRSKPYLFVTAYNAEGFDQFPFKLKEGRWPQAAGEVVISEEIAASAKVSYAIGKQLNLEIGDRMVEGKSEPLTENEQLQTKDGQSAESLRNTKPASFKVVGVIQHPNWIPAWMPGYPIVGYADEQQLAADDTADAYVVLKKVRSSLYEHAKELAKEHGIETVSFNNGLLRYYGITNNDGLRSMLLSLSAIIMTIIIVGSVALIYNAFAISVSERARHLGMLSSVGATKRQKRNSVFFEGMVIAVVSIPIGIVCGLAGIGVTFWLINSLIQDALSVTEKLTLTVTPASVAVACVVSLLTIFVSTYLPAVKASKISAIDAIRQTTDVKLTGKAVKTSKLVRKLFGIEAEIGLKNLKRNKRRYQATVFSLVISIVLFLAVSYFTDSLRKSVELSKDGINFDMQVQTIGDSIALQDERLIRAISSLPDVMEHTLVREVNATANIDAAAIADPLKELVKQNPDALEDGKLPYFIRLHALDEESLAAYARLVGADAARLNDPDRPGAIVIDTIPYKDMDAEKYVEMKAIHTEVGRTLDLALEDTEAGKPAATNAVEIAGLTDQFPMGILPAGLGGLNVIVSEQVLGRLLEGQAIPSERSYLYLKSSDPMKTQREIEEMAYDLYVYNLFQARQREEQTILLMSVFTYGFIALITAISIANIFNTISTSISLRKREFAMLKSVGMTPQGFNKMINYESIFYGIKAVLYGLPISVAIMYLIYRSAMNSFDYDFALPWASILYCLAAVFVIVLSAMLYSSAKVKKENIIDGLKQESI